MLKSMTGFGSGKASVGGEELSVEARSVNHKFCEVKVRLPRELSALETQVAKFAKERLSRGAIEIFARRGLAPSTQGAPTVDFELAREYRSALAQLADSLGFPDDVSVRDIASQPGVIRVEERGTDLETAGKALMLATEEALNGVVRMRTLEGEAIAADLGTRLALLEATAEELAKLAPGVVEEYRRRLTDRISELLKDTVVDPQRIAEEVVFFAERTDVAEEITRLRSHLKQFRELLDGREPAGRRMDFLVQELHREVNTTGSKSQSVEISKRIVAMKAELERVREQVQNVE